MRYQWDISKIKKRLITLQQLLQQETNPENRRVVLLIISQYQSLLSQFDINKNKSAQISLDFKNNIDSCITTLNECFGFPHHVDDYLFQVIIDTLDVIRKKLNGATIITEPKRIFYTNDELKDFTIDFFDTMLDKNFKNQALGIFDEQILNIQFYKTRNLRYSGVTFYDPIFQAHYINLFRENTVLDFVTLIHEIFHVLFGNNAFQNDYYENQFYFIEELEGSFANLLVSEYIKKYHSNWQIEDSIDCYYLLEYFEKTLELFISYISLKSMNKKNELRISKINKCLKRENLDFSFHTEKEILPYLKTPVHENICYNLSYLASLDLFSYYLTDPERTIDHLIKIKKNSYQKNIISFLQEEEFTFMNDGYQSLKKEIQKIKLL